MQGNVLGFDAAAGTGAIRGTDGSRYSFQRSDWKAASAPGANDEVDFEPVEGRATEIFVTRAALNFNLGKLSDTVDTAKVRSAAMPLLGSWHPLLALLTLLACFGTFLAVTAPMGANIQGYSPNLFGAPGALSQGLSQLAELGNLTGESNSGGLSDTAGSHGASPLVGLAVVLSYALYLIPVGSAYVVFQEVKRRPATAAAFFVGLLSVALPLLLYVGIGLVIQTELKDINGTIEAFGQNGYRVHIGGGGWTVVLAGALQMAASVRLIRRPPADFLAPAARSQIR